MPFDDPEFPPNQTPEQTGQPSPFAPPQPQYGAPEQQFAAPQQQYGQQQPQYGAPQPEYGQQQPQYGAPQQQFGAPQQQYGQQQPQQPYGQQQPQYGQQQYGRPTEQLAIWGLVCAFVCWPAGLVLSILARKKIAQTGNEGAGMAKAGLIVSIVAGSLFVLYVIFAIIVSVSAASSLSNLSDYKTTTSSPSVGYSAVAPR